MQPGKRVQTSNPIFNRGRWLYPVVIGMLTLAGNYCVRGQTPPTVVPTMAALRGLNVAGNPELFTNNAVALVIDYYTLGYQNGHGRGGGLFRWIKPATIVNSPADDGGRYILPNTNNITNGVWERMLQGETANVKMWGATGNGYAIDYTNIQNAINACEDSTWSGELSVPVGTYLITNTLVFCSGLLHLRGETVGVSTIVMRSNVQADILQTRNAYYALNGGAVNYDHNLLLENLKLYFQTNADGSHNRSNACFVLCNPGEASAVRQIQTAYGAFGIRCLGGGAPGLHVQDVTLNGAAVAGLSIEPVPPNNWDNGDPVSLMHVSGDMEDDTDSANACLIRFYKSVTAGEIVGLKAEGDFGGGVIQYTYVPPNTPSAENGWNLGIVTGLDIHNCSYSAGSTYPAGYRYPSDFVRLMPGGVRTPVITLRGNIVNGIPNLINDEMVGRVVVSDPATIYAGRWPIVYSSFPNGVYGNYSTLVVGQTALTTFVPGTNGWYRVLTELPPYGRISGRLTWKAPGNDNAEMQVDVNNNGAGDSDTWLNVTRATGLNYTPPIITEARAYEYYYAPIGGMLANVDLYVGNATTNNTITVGWELNGYVEPGEIEDGGTQLMGQVEYLGTPGLPASYGHLTTVKTSR